MKYKRLSNITKCFFLLITSASYSQATDKMPLFHIAPEVSYLIEFNDSRQGDTPNDFIPVENEQVLSTGIILGYNISKYISLGGFVSSESILNRNLRYGTYAIAFNSVLNHDKDTWIASLKIGQHFGSEIREAGILLRGSLGFRFKIFDFFYAQTEFIYGYQALRFDDIIDVETRRNLTLNTIGIGVNIYF